ncbi:hypothetical protein G7092_02735 [Mucilaginibacter sp. HC2]|uniref:hypothetical protein n=1 Tax=Mucilaginibacter inviolabilis TaxID=2714892 RepID=UPI00140A3C0B|nr:hypothetical protein [Mucilaginibacter inviolabilis]NHA02692.1 hypothetical protein [Mucilaginibacter inviolabilis]
MNDEKNLIPPQQTGRATDFSEEKKYPSKAEAHAGFKKTADKFLNINQWHEYSGAGSAIFTLCNNQGEPASGYAAKGALMSIELPVPGSDAGKGLEWVMIEDMDAHSDARAPEEFIAMIVRPCPEPHETRTEIAHFYQDISTSTFIVKRSGKVVSAAVHGRNETPNNANVDLHDKVRNTLVALSARVGLAGPQWKKLVKGLLAH